VGVEEESVLQNIVELADEAELEDVNDDYVEELLQSHGESLSNYELRELAEQLIQSESEAFDAKEETLVRDLTTDFLSNSITTIMHNMDEFINNDPDWERSS
jgi:tRNA splicing endonuclease